MEVDFPAGPAPVRFVATANPVDVAVMHLDPGVSVPGLGLADAAEVGMAGALIGFPGAGNRVRRDAAVMSFEEGNAGHDPARVARLDAVVVPGESGSPLVVDGKIAALVYESATTTHRARAIPAPELRGAMDAAARQDWARCGR